MLFLKPSRKLATKIGYVHAQDVVNIQHFFVHTKNCRTILQGQSLRTGLLNDGTFQVINTYGSQL
ncbi:hypothetical protein D4018_18870 [Escherichia coli]|uniref:Uncharacterized protein n=1 Tax=Escherichia coli TaxID=562 RepID=A0A2A7M8R6_ECOLX|nr:hypothetical protein [Escherichia coli]EYV95296.1 hypothetical protein BY41_10010 [Escherichia coli O86:H34 str. 99-3124]EAA5675186.1 hypothetical protein [Escherichia coli]EEV5547790.1 hypothetical protein [Escherichia coli]EEW3525207.1 hypothetical protein [Escherichia coli]